MQRRSPPPVRRHRIPLTGDDAVPVKSTARWVQWRVSKDGQVGIRPGPPDSMMRVRPLPGFVLAGSPEEDRQRADAEAEAVRRRAA